MCRLAFACQVAFACADGATYSDAVVSGPGSDAGPEREVGSGDASRGADGRADGDDAGGPGMRDASMTDATSSPPAPATELTYRRDIEPILRVHCVDCHARERHGATTQVYRVEAGEMADFSHDGSWGLATCSLRLCGIEIADIDRHFQ